MNKRRIDKGQPLNELVKGSLQYTLERIRTAFRQQFRAEDAYWNWYLVEVFADHVIVMDDQLPPDEFWRVASTAQGDSYLFAARDAWEPIELAYQSRTANERRRVIAARGGQITLVERLASGRIALLEAEAGTPRRIKARGMTANIVNANNRRYRTPILEAAVAEAQPLVAERRLLAESNHPSDKPGGQADILESLVRWDRITFEADQVLLEGEIIPTKGKGENLIILMEHRVYPRLSQRAHGKAQMVEESGKRFVDITELHITGYDLVMDPGDPTADTLVFETRQAHSHEEDPITMDKLTLEALRAQYPELVAQIERERAKLEEALLRKQQEDARDQKLIAEREASLRQQLGLAETDDLAEAMQRQTAELNPAPGGRSDPAGRRLHRRGDRQDHIRRRAQAAVRRARQRRGRHDHRRGQGRDRGGAQGVRRDPGRAGARCARPRRDPDPRPGAGARARRAGVRARRLCPEREPRARRPPPAARPAPAQECQRALRAAVPGALRRDPPPAPAPRGAHVRGGRAGQRSRAALLGQPRADRRGAARAGRAQHLRRAAGRLLGGEHDWAGRTLAEQAAALDRLQDETGRIVAALIGGRA